MPWSTIAARSRLVAAIDADVDLDRLCCRQAARTPLLKHAQQLGLHLERDIADLVEEERAAVGELEAAHFCAIAPVNAPFSWPNSSLSSSAGGHRGAVDLDEGAIAPAAALVDRARNSSLPVPVSPRTSTVEPVGATTSTSSSTWRSAPLSPTIESKWCSLRISLSKNEYFTLSCPLSCSIFETPMRYDGDAT